MLSLLGCRGGVNMFCGRIFMRKMSQNVTSKLVNNAEKAEKRLSELKNKVNYMICIYLRT